MCRRDQDSDVHPPPEVDSWQGLMGEAQVFSRSSSLGKQQVMGVLKTVVGEGAALENEGSPCLDVSPL